MRVIVTGGTGFIGKALVRALHEKGHSPIVLSRSGQGAQRHFAFPIETAKWDASQQLFPSELLSSAEGIIHLAGEGVADKRWTESRKKEILESRTKGTRLIVDALKQNPGKVRSFVGASAIGVYGDRGDEALSEESSLGSGFLADVCKAWEKESDSLPPSVRRCIVRIGIVLEEGGGALKPLLPLFRLGLGGRVGTGNQWMSWIHREDLVSLFVFLLEHENVNGIFNGVSPNPVTNKDFTKQLGAAVHRPTLFPAPAFAMKLAMGELSSLVLDSQRVEPRRTQATGFTYHFSSLSVALENIAKKKA